MKSDVVKTYLSNVKGGGYVIVAVCLSVVSKITQTLSNGF